MWSHPFRGNKYSLGTQREFNTEDKEGGEQELYCEVAFVGVPCKDIVGEREAICSLVNCIRHVQSDQRILIYREESSNN